jgi:hypothetical protein
MPCASAPQLCHRRRGRPTETGRPICETPPLVTPRDEADLNYAGFIPER